MKPRYSFSSHQTRTMAVHNNHREAFPKLVREMIGKCEIILEVIDARFIDETRNVELEKMIKEKGVKIIFVMNKSDLVNIDEKKKEIELKGLYPFVFVSCSKRKGSKDLRKRIKIEAARIEQPFAKTNIGVVGYPNTGKSSLINFLVGKSSAKTAAEAGFTRGIQKLKLDKDTFILDTPGIIPEGKYSMDDANKMAEHTKISARSWDKIKQPEFVVHELIKEYPGLIEKHYGLNEDGDSDKFLEELGRKKHFLSAKGRIDVDKTARLVLKDWQEGKIRV